MRGSGPRELFDPPDFSTIAGWIGPTLACSTWAAATAACSRTCASRAARSATASRSTTPACWQSIGNGVNVIQSDLESGLAGFDDRSFDSVILSQTLQAMRHTEQIVLEMLRVGREAIVTFPNFGHWSHRLQVLRGRMPVSKNLPYQWYDTPNIHLCTVADFDAFCAARRFDVLERVVLHDARRVTIAAEPVRLAGHLSLPARRRGCLIDDAAPSRRRASLQCRRWATRGRRWRRRCSTAGC